MSVLIKGSVVFQGHDPEVREWGKAMHPTALVVGTLYDVTDIEVHSWHTLVTLHGVTGKFNTAYFKWTDEVPFLDAIAAWRLAHGHTITKHD
jgi:hypothetical protein